MAIGVIVRLKATPGRGADFEAAFAVQAAGVRSAEPGNRLYELAKSRTEDDAYVVMEIYEDAAAFDAHRTAQHMIDNRPRMAGLVAPGTSFEIFDVV